MVRPVAQLDVKPSKPAPPLPPLSPRSPPWPRWIVPIALVGYTVWSFLGMRAPKPPSISYSELYGFVEQGKVGSVSLSGQQVTGKLKQEETSSGKKITDFQTVLPQQDDRDLLPLLRAQHVNVEVISEHTSLLEQAAISFLPWVLILGGWFWISRRMQKIGSAGLPFGAAAARTRRVERQDGRARALRRRRGAAVGEGRPQGGRRLPTRTGPSSSRSAASCRGACFL
jgi:cell division protease FtsH